MDGNIPEIKKIHRMVEKIMREREASGRDETILTGRAAYGPEEVNAVLDSLLAGWLGLAGRGEEFERQLAGRLGLAAAVLVNSGSSANLLALAALKTRKGLEGGEVIVPALSFPTTVNPVVQLGFRPVFIDCDGTWNITPAAVEAALGPESRGLVFSHILGNPAPAAELAALCRERGLFMLEDCCESLDSRYKGRFCGTFGDAATFSFYPSHHITLGEGGAVVTDSADLAKLVKSLRDWGRDCVCRTDEQSIRGRCGKRLEYDLGGIEYDHRYVYSSVGYNLKPLELQAAFGLVQLKRLEEFSAARRRNFALYCEALAGLENVFSLPDVHPEADPVFFGFPLAIRDPAVKRKDLLLYLDRRGVSARLPLAGNITRQPAYRDLDFRISGDLKHTDRMAESGFWLGLHPGIGEAEILYIADVLKKYAAGGRRA